MGAASRSADENSNGISHRWMDTLPLLTPATVRKLARTSLRLSAQYRAIAQVVEDYNTHLCGQEDPGDIPRILPAGWVRQARAECSIEPRFWSTSVFPWTSHFFIQRAREFDGWTARCQSATSARESVGTHTDQYRSALKSTGSTSLQLRRRCGRVRSCNLLSLYFPQGVRSGID
jgi:hypothetical protein